MFFLHWVGRAWPWLAAGASGGLLVFSFPPFSQSGLVWFALVPLLCAVWFSGGYGRRLWRRHAALGLVAGVVFFTGTLHWLTTVHVIGWLVLSVYLALFFAAWALLAGLMGSGRDFLNSWRNLLLALHCAGAWVACEWLRGWLFTGFGWNSLGVSLHGELATVQIAEFTGVAGLSFLICFCNVIALVTVRRLIAEVRCARLRPHWDFTITILVVALTFAHGVRVLLQPEVAGVPLKVAAIQPNIPQTQKTDERYALEIIERLRGLTEPALALQPELLLWPEAAVPGGAFSSPEAAAWVKSFCAGSEVNLLIGTDEFAPDGDFNSAALLSRGGTRLQVYRKLHLVPFGEFIPFRHSFPLFAWIAGHLVPGDFSAGKEPVVLETDRPAVKLGVLICFEDTLSDLARRLALGGAQLLVNLTNDGWFLQSPAAEQHLANAVFRAIENRRPLVRCANTGVTCFIDTRGRVTHALRDARGSHFLEGILAAQIRVPNDAPTTLFTRHGDWLALVGALVAAHGIVARLHKGARQKRRAFRGGV